MTDDTPCSHCGTLASNSFVMIYSERAAICDRCVVESMMILQDFVREAARVPRGLSH